MPRADPPSIVLIGPKGVGKSTQGRLLASALQRPNISLDALCWRYYAELEEVRRAQERLTTDHGADQVAAHDRFWFAGELGRHLTRELGPAGAARYKEVMELHALRRALEEHAGSIIDLGAGHSLFADEDNCAAAQALLAGCPHVVLLMPYADVAASVAILHRNLAHRVPAVSLDRIRYYVDHPSNRRLATHTVYTEERTPAAVCERILAVLGERGEP